MSRPRASFSESRLRELAGKGLSITAIALELDRERSATKRALKRFGIKTHGKHGGDRKPRRPGAGRPAGVPDDTVNLRQLSTWPTGIHFTDAKVPRNIGYRAPSQQQAESLIGNSSAMCEAA